MFREHRAAAGQVYARLRETAESFRGLQSQVTALTSSLMSEASYVELPILGWLCSIAFLPVACHYAISGFRTDRDTNRKMRDLWPYLLDYFGAGGGSRTLLACVSKLV